MDLEVGGIQEGIDPVGPAVSQPEASTLFRSLQESGLRLYSEGFQPEAFLSLFAATLHAHRFAQHEPAAAVLSTIVNLVQWPAEESARRKIADVLRAHQQELLDYPQYITAGLRLAGLLGDTAWAMQLASHSVARQAVLSQKVGNSDVVAAGAVPSLVIAGFMKCGTTSLYDFVSQQSWALPSAAKEIGWLGAAWGQSLGVPFYKACFPAHVAGWDLPPFSIDAYPRYVTCGLALQLLSELDPVPLVAVMVRDPFERFVSHFEHDARLGITRGHSTIEEYARSIVDQVDGLSSQPPEGQAAEYLIPMTDSLYVPHIARWMERIGRYRLSVLDVTDLDDPAFMRGWSRTFLGRVIDPQAAVPTSNANPSRKTLTVERGSALDRVRTHLYEANRDLPDLIGRRLPWLDRGRGAPRSTAAPPPAKSPTTRRSK